MDQSESKRGSGTTLNTSNAKREQSADIFKLHIPALEEIFDYLGCDDLIAVGQTCKRLSRVVGYILEQNYPNLCIVPQFQDNNIYLNSKRAFPVNDLVQYFRQVNIFSNDALQGFISVQSKFRRLRKIQFRFVKLDETTAQRMKETLAKVRELYLNTCKIEGDLDTSVLIFCSNLKHLYFDCFHSSKAWLQRKYPSLEVFHFAFGSRIEEIIPFLKLNPNIRDIYYRNLNRMFKNRELMFESNIKLDMLSTRIPISDSARLNSFVQFLNELHDRGFYKRLELRCSDLVLDQHLTVLIASLKALQHVSIFSSDGGHLSATSQNIEEINFCDSVITVDDAVAVATGLTNLKRVAIVWLRPQIVPFDVITPFLRHSRKLKEMTAVNLVDGIHFNAETKIINLTALNRERATLQYATKVTLYVEEDIYLATKLALQVTNFEFIALKRA